ncbi:acyl-CoA thioesterase [Endozoicomonas sp. SM1973]|uniref:Acyl-CoA thioesterase n=1 Tax=Spartinivicinus marinus TaxID=2994442 RepID=A0A853IB78_9GAMM|nr:acyl-CoA thioesterase [Spartinivicinus marinus]MCX4028669.1 acyl-CoA thioesterase [Spartinivicinus marinus]NYZ69082.1 acyl-CoA thioesterase [Spartinivicinus marinus]
MSYKHTLKMSELVTPEVANFSGKMHGGDLLKLLDRVAYTCAMRYCASYVVTLSVDKVLFKDSIEIGELVTCLASVNYTGNTSMEVGIRVVAEDICRRKSRHTNSCYFTMVSLDENGKPTQVPPFTPQTANEKRRYQEAIRRRKIRLETAELAS